MNWWLCIYSTFITSKTCINHSFIMQPLQFSATFPLLYNFCNACGTSTISFRNNDPEISKLWYTYCLVATGVFCYTSWRTLLLSENFDVHNDVYNVVYLINYISSLIYVITQFIFNCVHYKKRLNLLTNLQRFDKAMETVYRPEGSYITKKVVILIIVITFIKLVVNVVYVYRELIQFVPPQAIRSSMIFFILGFNLYEATYLDFFIMMNFVKIQLIFLNKALRIKFKESNATVDELKWFEKLHRQISSVVEDINDCYGNIFLVQFAMFFIENISGFYCAMKYSEGFGTSIFRTINAILKCLFLCSTADRVSEEIKSIGMAIYKIDTQEIRILDEIEVISLHMINNKAGIQAAGFFTINNKLFYSMVHGIITYIIILIQLSP